MFKKILVTVDGSEASEAILPQVERAADSGTEIILFTVQMIPEARAVGVGPTVVAGVAAPGGTVNMPAPRVLESTGQAVERVRDEQTIYLNRLAEPLRKAGLSVKICVAFGWDPGEVIVSAAREQDVDAIFMATHGRTALGQIVFGSVAEYVLRAGVRPVFLVRPAKLN